MKLEGKIAAVTGSAAGIGRAMKEKLLEKGCRVIGIDIGAEEYENERELSCRGDISDEEVIRMIRDKAKAKFGRVDLLINNAGVQTVAPFEETTIGDFRRVINVNLTGTFICTKLFTEIMPEGSAILNVVSVHHDVPRLDKFGYDASKAGEAMLTKEIALALCKRRITCNAIAIGAVSSPMNADWLDDPEAVAHVRSNIPMGWIARPEEIAQSEIHILEDFADLCTGSIFTVDGGRSLR
ncbi:MAG: SDR family oxidoreductase [Erysipelotrichaceae bacterium]|nr:SDR family oxidoreductase [Erysipelotrichaceae bacterium]